MINKKKVNKLLIKCENAYKFREYKLYLWVSLISLLCFVGICILDHDNNTKRNIDILFLFVFYFIFLFFIFVANTSTKFASIKFLIIYINYLMNPITDELFNNKFDKLFINSALKSIHPIFKNNSVIMFILGCILIKKDYEKEGKYLIELAIEKEPDIKKININNKLKNEDAEYLLITLKKDPKLTWSFNVIKLWNKKPIKYIILIMFFSILIINLLIQITKAIMLLFGK